MSIASLEEVTSEWLTPEEVSKVIGCNPQSLRVQARQNPSQLGFPVCVMGSTVRIPKDGFLFWCRFGYARP